MTSNSSQSRIDKATEIANNPADYKVCEGCDSIVIANTTLCPNCHGYRFDTQADRVVDQAVCLGSREQQSVTVDDML